MPILDQEISQYPDHLLETPFEELTAASDVPVHWYAVYTLSRQEKVLMRKLREQGVFFYCPIAPQKRRSPAGRVRTSYLPLFTNYVFVCGDQYARLKTFETNCISRCLEVSDPASLHEQLHAIEQLIRTEQPVTLESILEPGTPVRIRSGSMKGVVGKIVQRRGVDRLVVTVDFLQQGASVELNDWDVEPY